MACDANNEDEDSIFLYNFVKNLGNRIRKAFVLMPMYRSVVALTSEAQGLRTRALFKSLRTTEQGHIACTKTRQHSTTTRKEVTRKSRSIGMNASRMLVCYNDSERKIESFAESDSSTPHAPLGLAKLHFIWFAASKR